MTDKEKLKKLIELFGDLIKIEGNEWMVNAIISEIEKNTAIDDISKNSIIQNIHEHCIEKIIDKQAHQFYKSFPITDLKVKLIQDFKKMEHERRRDDFESFCLCVYQQIENITNYLFNNYILDIWTNEKDKPAIKSEYNGILNKYIFPSSGGLTVAQLISPNSILNEDPLKWHAGQKFKAVLFFFYFNKEITRSDYHFISIYYAQDEIYQIRNRNHRGSQLTDYQQKSLSKIISNEAKYYFKFYGFLQDYVYKITETLNS